MFLLRLLRMLPQPAALVAKLFLVDLPLSGRDLLLFVDEFVGAGANICYSSLMEYGKHTGNLFCMQVQFCFNKPCRMAENILQACC